MEKASGGYTVGTRRVVRGAGCVASALGVGAQSIIKAHERFAPSVVWEACGHGDVPSSMGWWAYRARAAHEGVGDPSAKG
jgi:hypothetical protein